METGAIETGAMETPVMGTSDEPSPWQVRPPDRVADSLQRVLRLAALSRPAIARRLELNLSEVWALEHVSGEPIGTVELARRLDMTSAAATVLVHRLVEAGHMVREPHPTDGRRTVLRATPHAFQQMAPVMGPLLADLDTAAATLSPTDHEVVATYLDRIADALGRLVDHRTDPTG